MPACEATVREPDFAFLFFGFQSRDPELSRAFFDEVSPRLKRLARRYLQDLPQDIQDEVVGETLMLLLQPGRVAFDPIRGSPWEYVHGFALNAVKNLRTKYGRRRPVRKRNQKAGKETCTEAREVPLDELSDQVPAENLEEKLHNFILVRRVLGKASPTVRFALERIYFDGRPRTRVAEDLKMDRFALQRQMAAFAVSLAAARPCA